ncbi:MAG: hypothetical protein ABMA01_22950 [Chthoniobacteraceae bacterium]
MATQARVTSIDALGTFRAALIVFLTKAQQATDNAGDQLRRTRAWLQNDRRVHWEAEIRRRQRTLDQAEQELYSARLSHLTETVTVRQAAVRKARRAVEEAEAKLKNVKRWNQNFDNTADPLIKKLSGLREYLDHEMPDALAFLANAQMALEAYAQDTRPRGGAVAAPAPAAEGEAQQDAP